jgi:hypothetical protein
VTTPTSPYRTDIDALREKKETLARELERVRRETAELESLRAEETKIAKELADVESRLRDGAAGGGKRALPLLDQVRVASPCSADWNEMVGDDRVRFCLSCEKHVFNLSAMPREEAEALLRERLGGELCVRFYQRADGTIMTQDCPVGVKKKRRKMLALAVAGAGAMAAAAMVSLTRTQGKCANPVGMGGGEQVKMGEPSVEPMVMGTVAVPPPAAPTTDTPHPPGGPSHVAAPKPLPKKSNGR